MCGIVGKIALREPIERSVIERMCSVVEHRGPDSRGIFVDANVGLGVQRLAIIDLETGDQPIFNEDRSVVVVLNGEIYNYRELRESLLASGHRFGTHSDTEVIVHLYEEHGDELVQSLRGMFAFALWDLRRRRLLLARDRIGKKPLYFRYADNTLWFASEAKAILQDPEVPRAVDPTALDSFLQYLHVPHQQCAFSSLSKLAPAHTLVLEDERVTQRRYWKLSYANQLRLSDAEATALIREQLLEATRLRLRSDVPVGAFLSGGVDSSAVVAAMAHAGDRVKTFTIGFPNERFDEREHAREIAQLFATDHHEFVVEPRMVELLPRLAWFYDEPFADHSAVPSFYLSELTRREVTVALNGDGGDESFVGYRRYVGNDVATRLQWIPSVAARLIERGVTRVGTGTRQDTTRARVLRLARGVQLDPAERYAGWIACFTSEERRRLYTDAFAAEVGTARPEARIDDAYTASDATTLVERLLDVDTQTYLADQLLVKMDIASMAHSLEVRSPLLDHEFMETAASLPLAMKMRGRVRKRLFKEAVRAWIPGRLLDRPKQGFSMPIAAWFRDELRHLPSTLLLDERARDRNLFEPREIERLIGDHRRGSTDNGDKLWALIQLELWFRTYVDTEPSGPVAVDISDVAVAA